MRTTPIAYWYLCTLHLCWTNVPLTYQSIWGGKRGQKGRIKIVCSNRFVDVHRNWLAYPHLPLGVAHAERFHKSICWRLPSTSVQFNWHLNIFASGNLDMCYGRFWHVPSPFQNLTRNIPHRTRHVKLGSMTTPPMEPRDLGGRGWIFLESTT